MPRRKPINIALQLEILPVGKIIIPGCEPTSALSSNKLSSWMAQQGCGKNALVDLKKALEAIPGSWVKHANNFNRGGTVQRWFVFPATDTDCPCAERPDYYQMLRDIATEELPVEEICNSCDTIGMGYCPSPDFNDVLPPPASPYQPEGTFPAGVGVLPPIPPWGISGT